MPARLPPIVARTADTAPADRLRPGGVQARPVATRRRAEVVIVQRRLPHYRVPLFTALKERLDARGIHLRLIHGQPTADEAAKGDSGELAWAEFVPCTYAGGGSLCWQALGSRLDTADLVVMTPENRLLYNLWVQWMRRGFRVALWGHGANFQGAQDTLRERFKRKVARHADWWFAYTAASLPHLARSGFPRDRVTVLNNAIDTSALHRQRAAVQPARLQALAAELGLGGGPVGVYVGSLYAEKRVGFLLEAACRVRELVPGFELIVVGDGPDRGLVERFGVEHPWVHPVGLRFGQDKVDLMSLASVAMNPGMVGLSILDALILETPLVTTDCGTHSPEIAYLEHGRNGLMTPDALEPYAQAVAGLLRDPAQLASLRRGCAQTAALYTIERMADTYVAGIVDCLARAPHRRGVPAVPTGAVR